MRLELAAYVTQILFDGGRAAFALGDGTVCWDGGARVEAHQGAILAAAAHPLGDGVITGGDDGRVAWARPGGCETLAELPGRWIDAIAVAPAQGLIAFAAGREAHVRDVGNPEFARVFTHEHSVAALAFEPKGRRLAAATYGGAALWYAKIAEQRAVMLRGAGSHIALAFSPDGRFLVSAMQEAAVHGWRLADAKDMRMGGYPAKAASLVFVEGGARLATSGASGAVLWPFTGANGPMGRQAEEIGLQEGALVTRVAAFEHGGSLAAGLSDGRVWACDLAGRKISMLKPQTGPAITALAVSAERVAWGDEEGGAGVFDLRGS
jgi:WD40 repeat protein